MDSHSKTEIPIDKLKQIPDFIVDQTSISIGRDLKDFLDTLKVTPRESYHAEIKRLLEGVPI